MKVIIPAAGDGVRLRPHTYTMPKPLIPVAGKTIIAFIIDKFVKAGVEDFVFVLRYMSEQIEEYLEENYPNINKEYVMQGTRMGLGHAIWTARETFKNQEDIIIMLGDTILELDVEKVIESKQSGLAIKKVQDPRLFGVVEVNDEGAITQVIEKPKIPKSNQAIAGLYHITDVPLLIKSLDHLIQNDIRTLGEFHLTDALMGMITAGHIIKTHEVSNWYDCGQKEILLETNKMLLKRYGSPTTHKKYDNTIIIPPVAIGENCEIKDSIIGPHVTIASNAIIEKSIITDSVLGNYVNIHDLILNRSLIGNDVVIRGKAKELNVGANNELGLG